MKNSTGTMLDLSFLTEEEYQKLVNVLHRDAELQKKDSDRIRRLQGSIKDEKKKKFVTGEWFHDVKAQRFQEDLQGSELLRASIRKKKNRTQNQPNTATDGTRDKKQGPLTFAEPQVDQGYERASNNQDEEKTQGAMSRLQAHPPSLPEPSTPCTSDKRSSIHDLSPVDSAFGLSPSLSSDAWNLQDKGNHHGMLSGALTDLLEYDENGPKNSTPKDTSLRKSPAVPERKSLWEESSPSKIPVKRKPSKETSRPETLFHLDQSDSTFKKREISGHSGPSSPDADFVKDLKTGSNFTVHSMKDKQTEQDNVLDKGQFMSLKNFWEKGGDGSGMHNISEPEMAEPKNSQEPPARPNRTVSVQYSKKNGEEKQLNEHQYKLKPFSHREQIVSSSEDEHVPIAPPRKLPSSSMIPRSTYSKSKGSPLSKSVSLSEATGSSSPSHSEESSGTSRSSKKSKLPVRASSVSKETPSDTPSLQDDKLPIVSEPEGPSLMDEINTTETKQDFHESQLSKVQILIDMVTSDEERGKIVHTDAERGSEELMAGASLETENDKSIDETPEPTVTSQHSSVTNARSMVNIYTTMETYNKPQTLSHQLLEPERAKELSKSTPALLSETESDTASEISFQLKRHRKTYSSGSNSSDMASVSSVSNSVLSVYSGDFGSVDAQGTVQFSLDYDEKKREFQIFVAQCKDLAVVDEKKGRSDPYVKTYLLPDKARMGKRKTSVKRRTTNPVYNELLVYKIDKMVLLIQKLNLSVWHNDPLGRNSFLGEMEIDLTCWDWSNTKPNWYTLKPRCLSAMNGVDHLGVMNLSIKYIPPGSLGPKHPTSGEVHIWVKDTKDLPQLRPSGVDSFVKCYVLPDTSKKSYQKTRVIKKDPNPVFNHTIVYDGFHTEDLKDACVELTVWDHEKLSNHFLGGIRLGLGTGFSYGIAVDWMDSTQEEVAFWQEMMLTPNDWIEGSLPLRSLAGRRKFK
ncbi:synaptotagmin-like protein 2 [Rhinophrynus dorsalis]